MELKRALRILLETLANDYKDNIINLHIPQSTEMSSVLLATCISSIEVNISSGQYSSVETSKLPMQRCLKFENNVEPKDTLINRPSIKHISSFHHNAEKELETTLFF